MLDSTPVVSKFDKSGIEKMDNGEYFFMENIKNLPSNIESEGVIVVYLSEVDSYMIFPVQIEKGMSELQQSTYLIMLIVQQAMTLSFFSKVP